MSRLTRSITTHFTSALRLVLAGALALALLAPTGHGHAQSSEAYETCLYYAQKTTDACLAASDTWYGDLACEWAGGVLIMGCALLEAGRIIGGGVGLPPIAQTY
ncbi:MAG TPA: hypothetical protein VFY16_12580 [Gemmatimonadaceae bacterium]|nr:hypothetical protein [Gemmatimonadaceae bacterium]